MCIFLGIKFIIFITLFINSCVISFKFVHLGINHLIIQFVLSLVHLCQLLYGSHKYHHSNHNSFTISSANINSIQLSLVIVFIAILPFNCFNFSYTSFEFTFSNLIAIVYLDNLSTNVNIHQLHFLLLTIVSISKSQILFLLLIITFLTDILKTWFHLILCL